MTPHFKHIDLKYWPRTPYYKHYFEKVRCTYSVTSNIDITVLLQHIKKKKIKLYPVLIYALTKIVNRHEEFRTTLDSNNNLGVWDFLNPCYTVFHEEDETFSNIWTEWNSDFKVFIANYMKDIQEYGKILSMEAKPDTPPNIFTVSSLPWTTFTGFNLNVFTDGSYLLPIFTWGKYYSENGKVLIPLSVQAHHAVCDGFHVSRFINELQAELRIDPYFD